MKLFGFVAIMVVLPLLCTILFVFGVIFSIRLIRRQIRLHNSIELVELRATKIHYWMFALFLLGLALYCLAQFREQGGSEFERLQHYFQLDAKFAMVPMLSMLMATIGLMMMTITMACSRSAIVDRGIHTTVRYFDWYHVHDYIIDEALATVILTTDKSTFLTLGGTLPPFRVARRDIPKLIFILNKNKNKFSVKL